MKGDDFMKGLAEWHKKYSSLFTNEEIDKIFKRERTIDSVVRHPEDFVAIGDETK